ncbi:MAG TPA: hypothetical protein VIN05_13995 [Roseovarius sp.]
MTSLPDTFMPDGPLRRQRDVPAHFTETPPENTLRRGALRCAAVGSLMAAAGLWLLPVVPGDALMQLFKLALSALLAMGGIAILVRTRRPDGPEVHVDTQARRLMIVERDAKGTVRSERCHPIDELQEIVLRDDMLTARDAQGGALLALPVTDPAIQAALMGMLSRERA